MLGIDRPLGWRLDEDGLTIEVPDKMPCDYAYAFKISLK
jgi:hypothetical protein